MTPDEIKKQKRAEYAKDYYQKNKERYLVNGRESPKAKASRKKYREKPETKLKIRNDKLLRKYGLTSEDYEKLLVSQNYCCAGCKTHQLELTRILNVDHDHETGKVRGLLCGNCNRALGLVKDKVTTLKSLINYLDTYND